MATAPRSAIPTSVAEPKGLFRRRKIPVAFYHHNEAPWDGHHLQEHIVGRRPRRTERWWWKEAKENQDSTNTEYSTRLRDAQSNRSPTVRGGATPT